MTRRGTPSGGRRGRGFRSLGALPVTALDLPAARAQELRLAGAWRQVAGRAISERVREVRLRRGVLEIVVSDPRWAAALERLLPNLAGRVAARLPEVRIAKFRVRILGDSALPGPRSIAPPPSREDPPREGRREERGSRSGASEGSTEAEAREIREVSERYLRRADRARSSDGDRPR